MTRAVRLSFVAIIFLTSRLWAEEFPCRFITTLAEVYVDSYVRGNGRVACFDEYTNPYPGQYTARTWVVDQSTSNTVAEDSCHCDNMSVWNGVANAGPV